MSIPGILANVVRRLRWQRRHVGSFGTGTEVCTHSPVLLEIENRLMWRTDWGLGALRKKTWDGEQSGNSRYVWRRLLPCLLRTNRPWICRRARCYRIFQTTRRNCLRSCQDSRSVLDESCHRILSASPSFWRTSQHRRQRCSRWIPMSYSFPSFSPANDYQKFLSAESPEPTHEPQWSLQTRTTAHIQTT